MPRKAKAKNFLKGRTYRTLELSQVGFNAVYSNLPPYSVDTTGLVIHMSPAVVEFWERNARSSWESRNAWGYELRAESTLLDKSVYIEVPNGFDTLLTFKR